MFQNFGILIFCLGIILLGAQVFTNGIEWLGKRLRIAEGAVGSVLAAVGTALPETMIPVIAIFYGTEEIGKEIGIGAILGAPFMLSTLALFMAGVAGLFYKRKRTYFPKMNINPVILERDLSFFVVLYTIALVAAFIPIHVAKITIASILVVLYFIYVFITINSGEPIGNTHVINPCFFDRKCPNNPSLTKILLQVVVALSLIIVGAKFFVNEIEKLSLLFGVPVFVLSLIIAPAATELPEKFNSIIWISQGKDTLAMGNITGAMVFQSSLIPALGISLTPWILSTQAVISVVLALISALLLLYHVKKKGYITAYMLIFNGIFYFIFIYLVLSRVFF